MDYEDINMFDFASLGVSTLFMAVGTITCFKINQRGDSVNFIERIVTLTVPITLKIMAYFLGAILWAILLISFFEIGFFGTWLEPWIELGILIILEFIYYWRLWVWIKRISHDELIEKA